jgi:hypothetical protein
VSLQDELKEIRKALRDRGYYPARAQTKYPSVYPTVFMSPDSDDPNARPLTGCPHSVMITREGLVFIVHDDAESIDYALLIPERAVRVLLTEPS